MTGNAPKFRELSERQSRAMLRRHGFGRLAFTFKDRVDIEPIGYVVDGDWAYGRTSRGAKFVQLKHNPWVALEVDEVEGPLDWRSVVAHGTVYFLNPGGEEHAGFEKAVRLFRRFDRRTLQADDPTPQRTILFRIYLDQVTGRSASTAIRKQIKKGRAGER
jgi:nitroimidazol reductase NimA-like FMN-containing flavoprotein (pyridoxamine 5'-phosphate oxidase superfamily)